ncbi:DUF4097 family beta strand repeat-containing protein [Lactococcus protaetiae]|uniref:DUF4097 domain-containing protein n=1 Tax=Lactococcus protaetiae TaxID=2592653 RepID=A0A514Z7J1_9LACT|nr:DUF4097 family beta strand repeat-containing protein [Lactococcus protaetiae]QDK70559.1 DUF4097 domain-containing protein [Lactococcus protaetiae]
MSEALKTRLNMIFANYPRIPETEDLYDEVLANLTDHVADYITDGLTEDEAIEKALTELGDLTEVLDDIAVSEEHSLTDLSRDSVSNYNTDSYSSLPLVNEQVFSPADFDQISLIYQQDNVDILPSEDGQLHLLEFMNTWKSDYFAQIQSTKNQLHIQYGKRPKLFGKLLPFRSKIVFLIPTDYQKNLNLQLASGNLMINQVKLETLNIDCRSGNFKAENLKVRTLKTILNSGNGNFEQIESEKIMIEAKSGNLNLNKIDAYQADVMAISGNMRLNIADIYTLRANVKSGNLKVQSLQTNTAELAAKSGNVTVESELFTQLKVTAASGNAKVVVSDEAIFNFDLRSGHGNTRLSLPNINYTVKTQSHKAGYSNSESERLLYIETNSGNATVKTL